MSTKIKLMFGLLAFFAVVSVFSWVDYFNKGLASGFNLGNIASKLSFETDVDVDKEAAAEARKLAKKGNVVVEGRTQFHFLPESIKIFIKVDLNTAAKRIWKDLQNKITKQERNEGDLKSLSEARREIQKRDHSDAKRYIKYYGFDHRDELQYDFVIDTTKLTLEEVTKEIMGFIKKERLVTNRLSAHKVG